MLLLALVLVPALGAGVVYLDRAPARRVRWLVSVALIHLAMVAWAWRSEPAPEMSGWLAFDALGRLVLTLVSVVFAAVSIYVLGYQRHEDPRGGRLFEVGLLAFLSAASVVSLTHHFGLLWVGMEATTLATAPLIYDPRDPRSLEAVWKYLLVCSVGIALALLGTFFLATSQLANAGARGRPLILEDLVASSHWLQPSWLRAAFVLLLIGFGTKMGLAPMHTWLPDAHGEAPSPISALLSGALLNLAFLSVLRGYQVVLASGDAAFARSLLIGFGLLSMAVAAVFLLGQENYKRMLAYSSIEHMGILAVGVGISGVAAWASLLHMLGGSLAKAALFFAAGSLVIRYGTKLTRRVTGAARLAPRSAALFAVGLFALTGFPPFATFLSEVGLISGALRAGRVWLALVMLLLQVTIFAAMGSAMLGMIQGAPPVDAARTPARERESGWLVGPPAVLLALALMLGLWLPGGLQRALAEAATAIGGMAP
jgi:hydrogenase-4 component F